MNHRRPYYAKPGWTDRYAPLIEAAKVIGGGLLFVALLGGMSAALWLLAPAGAAYPR